MSGLIGGLQVGQQRSEGKACMAAQRAIQRDAGREAITQRLLEADRAGSRPRVAAERATQTIEGQANRLAVP